MSKSDQRSKNNKVIPKTEQVMIIDEIVEGRVERTGNRNLKLHLIDWLEKIQFLEEDDEDEQEMDEEELKELEAQENRIQTIIGSEDLEVTEDTLKTYLNYLHQKIHHPCYLTGIDEFEWEEYYIFGSGTKKEYEKLKKNRPSYTDIFKLLILKAGNIDEGIMIEVERESDQKKFTIPLAPLEVTDENSANYELIDDYSVWFFNY